MIVFGKMDPRERQDYVNMKASEKSVVKSRVKKDNEYYIRRSGSILVMVEELHEGS